MSDVSILSAPGGDDIELSRKITDGLLTYSKQKDIVRGVLKQYCSTDGGADLLGKSILACMYSKERICSGWNVISRYKLFVNEDIKVIASIFDEEVSKSSDKTKLEDLITSFLLGICTMYGISDMAIRIFKSSDSTSKFQRANKNHIMLCDDIGVVLVKLSINDNIIQIFKCLTYPQELADKYTLFISNVTSITRSRKSSASSNFSLMIPHSMTSDMISACASELKIALPMEHPVSSGRVPLSSLGMTKVKKTSQ